MPKDSRLRTTLWVTSRSAVAGFAVANNTSLLTIYCMNKFIRYVKKGWKIDA